MELKEPFLRINYFSPICYDVVNGITYLENAMSDFNIFCTIIELKEQLLRIKQKANF